MEVKYAGFWRRFLAYLIDTTIISIPPLGVISLLKIRSYDFDPELVMSILVILLGLVYFVYYWVKKDGQTLGNKLLAIRVVREDKGQITIGTGLVRYTGYYVSSVILYLGFLWVLWDKKKQAWHDKIAKTLVIKTEAKPKIWLALLISLSIQVFLVASLVVSIVFLRFNPFEKNVNQSMADQLASRTFVEVNEYRQQKGLPVLAEDSQLCAYAQRRLEQIAKAGGYNNRDKFLADVKNPEVVNQYFSNYSSVTYDGSGPIKPTTTPERLVRFWSINSQNSSVQRPLNEGIFTNGCVKADTDTIVIIFGARKSP